MNILFVCKYNRFRSKTAEALFNHYNKNKKIKAKSAGMIIDQMRPYVAYSVSNELLKRGIKIKEEQSQAINDKLIQWADKIIIVANNVSPDIFPKEKVSVWEIEDTTEQNLPKIKEIIAQIEEKIKELVIEL